MSVVGRGCVPDAGAPLPPLQQMERPAEDTLEGSGWATCWKAGRCRHVQVSELFNIEECDQAVMDFLAATEVGKFPPKRSSGMEQAQGLGLGGGAVGNGVILFSLSFFLSFPFCLSLISHLSFVSREGG